MKSTKKLERENRRLRRQLAQTKSTLDWMESLARNMRESNDQLIALSNGLAANNQQLQIINRRLVNGGLNIAQDN